MLSAAQIDHAVQLVLLMLERFEGLRLRPYLCPAGVWTIGLGTTRYPDGRRVRPTDRAITRDEAYVIARWQVRRDYLPAALVACPGIDGPGRLAAVVDFAYNLGAAALRGSTMRRRINAGRWGQVPAEMMRWTRAGGVVLRGLVRRRAAEVALL
jgi:lysozyme